MGQCGSQVGCGTNTRCGTSCPPSQCIPRFRARAWCGPGASLAGIAPYAPECRQFPPSMASLAGLGQLGDDIPPGGVEDTPCPPGWPEGVPCVLPGGLPTVPGRTPGVPGFPVPDVIITEEEAREREAEAYERGQADERGKVIMYTALGAVTSGLVGIALGRIFR